MVIFKIWIVCNLKFRCLVGNSTLNWFEERLVHILVKLYDLNICYLWIIGDHNLESGFGNNCGCLICLFMLLKDGLYRGYIVINVFLQFPKVCISFTFLLFIEATDLLQKLSMDSQTKTLEIPEPTKKVIFTLRFVWLIS